MKPGIEEGAAKVKPVSGAQKAIRLADFINENIEQIVSEWESFAQTLTPAANDMTPLALRNHIHEILAFIVSDINSPQTNLEQTQKSQGGKEKESAPTAAETHAALRLAGGFNIDQMVSEYRALRASVIKLWSRTNTQMDSKCMIDLTRFKESIDQELAESVSHYTHKVGYSKDLFVGILSHELRNPLNVISMSAQLITNLGSTNERQTMLAAQITESANRITSLVDDLLDMTRARFGSGFSVNRVAMDMEFVCRQLIDEMRAKNPTRTIGLEFSGDGKGQWDKARIAQVFSNLIGNAIQYSFQDSAIGVIVKCTAKEAVIYANATLSLKGLNMPPF